MLLRAIAAFVAILFCIIFLPLDSFAQSISVDFGDAKASSFGSKVIQMIGVLTAITLAPSAIIMMTSFTRIIIVLSILRTALGLQQTPPNMVLIGLSLFLTGFIMMPVLEKSYNDGIKPVMHEEMEEVEGFKMAIEPFKAFMISHTKDADLSLFTELSKQKYDDKKLIPITIIIPSFMLSELRRAFEIGFLIFLPFLIIDMLVASILMAMGMMMLPPVMISLPFKLIFFVLIDGWYMLCGSLIQSYG